MNGNEMSVEALAQRIAWTRRLARVSLGLVWVYEGLVPKLLFPHWHPEQTALVLRTGIYLVSPEATLAVLGWVQIAFGLWLLLGRKEKTSTFLATGFMAVLMVLVAWGRPSMLTDPFGALAKDACLIACAAIVWLLPATTPGKQVAA